MEASTQLLETQKIIKQRNVAALACVVMLFSNLFLSFTLFFHDKETVLVPNSLDQEASIINGKMSPSYLEAVTRDVINLMLNVTPTSAEYTSKSILKITHPKFSGVLKKSLVERNKDVVDRRISMFFSPQSISIADNKSVYVTGKLSTFLGAAETSLEDKVYYVEYAFEGFRPLVIDFYEVDPKAKEGGHDAKDK